MKNSILAILLFSSCLLGITSCGKKELKETKGVVTNIELKHDSLFCAKILVDEDTLLFKLADARFINGVFINGDSVNITYIEGHKDTLRALVVNVIPQAIRYLNPEAAKNDTLITLPVTSNTPVDSLSQN
jgi:hypothetical protein